MNIEITKVNDYFMADCRDCPGTPPIGFGDTKEEAVAALFYVMTFGSTGGPHPSNWLKYIREGEPIIINGKQWEDPTRRKVS